MILPIGISFERWAAEVTINSASPLPPPNEENWQEWAAAYVQQARGDVPNPSNFAAWDDWASRLLETENV